MRRGGIGPGATWAIVALGLPFIAALLAGLPTSDLTYHIRAGEMILNTGELPRSDAFTFTVPGQPWLDQQWGAQVLLGLLFRASGGWPGMVVVRATLIALVFALTYTSTRRCGVPQRTAAWLVIASFVIAAALPGSLALRPQLFALGLFALSSSILQLRKRNPAWVLAMPLVTIVWANLHGSFLLAPLLTGLAWLQDVQGKSRHRTWTLAATLGATLATLATPFGVGIFSYVRDLAANPQVTLGVDEWRPMTIRSPGGPTFFLSILAVAVLLRMGRRPVPYVPALGLSVFAVLTLWSGRNVVWWAVYVPPTIGPLLPVSRERHEPGSRAGLAVVTGLLAIAVAALPWWRDASGSPTSTTFLRQAPPGITRALDEILEPGGRMFNGSNWGAWLEFALPQHPVFVDSRIELFPQEVWDDYFDVSYAREGWQEVLDRWQIDVVVASRDDQAILIPHIQRDPGWQKAYEDADGLIFTRC